MWAVVLIVLAVAMAVGPVFMLRPSPQQRALATLRLSAQHMGFQIGMRRVGGGNKASELAFYRISWQHKTRIAPRQLQRHRYQHELHLAQHWGGVDRNSLSDPEVTALESCLEQLPEGCVYLDISTQGLSCSWTERGGQANLEQLLKALSGLRRYYQSQGGDRLQAGSSD